MGIASSFWLRAGRADLFGGLIVAKIRRVHIYDMDGTLVDSTHRYRTIIDPSGERIDLQHWRENEHRAYDDQLLPLAAQYREDLADSETYTIIATARVMNEPDWRFLKDKLGEPDYIISRPKDSTVSGKVLKCNGLARFFNLLNFREAEFVFYEDNIQYLKAVCDRFQIRGVYIPSKQGH